MSSVKLLLVLSVFVFSGIFASSVNGISCENVLSKLFPCQPFLVGTFGKISGFCCDGIQTLKQIGVYDSKDRKAICKCLKQALISIGIRNPTTQKAVLLPQLCNISLPFEINPTTDC
ncbi:hypothetical protein M9H77_23786 [Catharanthus roseus]|uniref:Uncharacterized protein n=1 Tax=Catharanthus roseus TaxID=4058 RepID=A0ACC0AYF2_CATRO|nr:hypothetical protein M9H77_23786 [Catharanthus roseus]